MQPTREMHRTKLFAGIAMILAPLLVAIAYVIGPALRSESVAQLEELAAAPGRADAAMIVGLTGLVLFVFATMGLVHLLRQDQPWLGQIGGLLAIAGMVLIGVVQGAFIAANESAQLDVTSAAAVYERVLDNPAMIVAFIGTLATAIGYVVLSAGFLMSGTAPTWSGALMGLGAVVQWFGIFVASSVVTIVGFGILFLALAPLGYQLMAEPDEAWEHPAHFEGFRPIIGAH